VAIEAHLVCMVEAPNSASHLTFFSMIQLESFHWAAGPELESQPLLYAPALKRLWKNGSTKKL
jgi:hypothetical protein